MIVLHIQVQERMKIYFCRCPSTTIVSQEREREKERKREREKERGRERERESPIFNRSAVAFVSPLRDVPIDLFLLGATDAPFDPLKRLTRA